MLIDLMLVIVVISIVGVIALKISSVQNKKHIFLSREDKSLDHIYKETFLSYDIVKGEFLNDWNYVAKVFGIKPEKMRPKDSFDEEFAKIVSHGIGDEISDLEDYFIKKVGKGKSIKRINTLEEYIVALNQDSKGRIV